MKKSLLIILAAALTLTVALAGCSNNDGEDSAATAQQAAPSAQAAKADPNVWRGQVAETMNAGGYTYVLLDSDGTQRWVAGPETTVAVGDEVIMGAGMEMKNFKSNAMDRTFDSIYFVGAIEQDDGHTHAPGEGHAATPAPAMGGGGDPHGGLPGMGGASGAASEHTSVEEAGVQGVAKASGGVTVAEIYGGAAELAGKNITLRGRVVKFTPNIMGTNWIHIQDGTGNAGTHDLTVTTAATVQVGDQVLVKGPVSVNKDFGAGYRYAVIVENADVTVE